MSELLTPNPTAPMPPAPPPPLFGERWPGPTAPPSRVVLAAIGVAGVAAAVAVPEGRPGVGWFVVALTFAAAALAVRWRTGRSLPPRPALLAEAGWTVAAVALAGVAALRDAEWLVALCLLAACAAGSLAVVGRSFRGVVTGTLAVPVAALRGLPWVGRALLDSRRGANRGALRLLASGLVGLGLLAVFVPLLASADAAFARIVDGLVPTVDASSGTRWVSLFVMGAWALVGACYLLVAPPTPLCPVQQRPSRLRSIEWAVPVGALVGLFALFVTVQFATLFGSDGHVLSTTGPTYAEYARSGFWQLLVVTVLTFGVIVAGLRWAPSATAGERIWKRSLLATLAVLTLVIVASALSRMWLYQQAYGHTVLRLVVFTTELWLGAGFLLVLAAVLRLRPTGLARGMAAMGTITLLGLAVLDPEGFVAERNVARYEATGQIDVEYLRELSADAVPALNRLPAELRECTLAPTIRRLASPDTDWRSANTSRGAAAALVSDLPAQPDRAYC